MCKLGIVFCLICVSLMSKAAETCVWHEEFNSSTLDTTYWTPEVNFVRNIEAAQIYTSRPKNLSIKEGALTLTAYHEAYENQDYKPESKDWRKNRKEAMYTSGSINSRGKVAFRYGRVEIRAKVEAGQGVWPALWMIGNNPGGWPACGEIDILEYVSQDPQLVHATLHYNKDDVYLSTTNPYQASVPVAGDWHIYELNWTPEKIEIFYDKTLIFSYALDAVTSADGKNPFREGTFYFILNLALDGWAETPDPLDYPRSFYVDYVRLYQDDAIEGKLLELPSK